MKIALNMITLALLTTSSGAFAYDFGVDKTNQTNVNFGKWKCKRCKATKEEDKSPGDITVYAGYADQDNDHASNYTHLEDGSVTVVDANYSRKTEAGTDHTAAVDGLGSLTGSASLNVRQSGKWSVETGYRRTHNADHMNGQSLMQQSGSTMSLGSSLSRSKLYKEREITEIDTEYRSGDWNGYFKFSNQKRSGNKRSSFSTDNYEAYNFANKIDDDIYNFEIGTGKQGKNWNATLGYMGSWYDNGQDKLVWDTDSTEQSQDSANESHTLFISGQYRFDKTQIVSRISHGYAESDTSSPKDWSYTTSGLYASDIKVYNTNASLRINSKLTDKTRLNITANYSDRNNETDISSVSDTSYTDSYKPFDISSYQLAANASHRYSHKWKATGGFDFTSKDRPGLERERTDDVEVWLGTQWKPAKEWKGDIKLSHLVRSGSDYDEGYLTSSNASPLMRKFYLANKNRDSVRLTLNYLPSSDLNMSLRGAVIVDDYKDTQIGLTEVNQYRLDGDILWSPISTVQLGLFAGYQWLDNDQLGSDTGDYATWRTITDEEYGYAGTNLAYSGFEEQGFLFDVDYILSYSESWTRTSFDGYLGDYRSYAHNVKVNGSYQVNEGTSVGLSYHYARHFDSDYANIASNDQLGEGVYNLETLGLLNNNYNAHLVMISLKHKF